MRMLKDSPINIKLQHPKGLYILGFAEAWDRISYYGIQAILVLYLTNKFLFSDYHAYASFGIYSALGFATPVLGGYIADRYLGLRTSISLGMLLIIIGNVILMTHTILPFYTGLAFLVLGIGLFKGNAATQLGLCYQSQAIMRESGFTLFYVAMNLGSIIGPILFGLSGVVFGWHFGFLASGLGMLVAAIFYFIHYHYFAQNNNAVSTRVKSPTAQIFASFVLLFVLFVFIVAFEHPNLFASITGLGAVIIVISFIVLIRKSSTQERRGILVFIAFCIFTIMTSAGEMQTGSSMLIFIDRQVDHRIMGCNIPVAFFASLEPIAVIILAFLLSTLLKYLGYKKHTISAPFMVSLGVLLTGISFLFLALSASANAIDGFNMRLWLLVVGNIVMGAGELCSIPIVMSAIEFLAPKHLKGFFMGIYFLAFAFSGYFAGLMAMLGDTLLHKATLKLTDAIYYRDFFGVVGLMIIVTAIIAYILSPQLKRMMHTP